jgi:hypothetical protein
MSTPGEKGREWVWINAWFQLELWPAGRGTENFLEPRTDESGTGV